MKKPEAVKGTVETYIVSSKIGKITFHDYDNFRRYIDAILCTLRPGQCLKVEFKARVVK